MFIKSPRDKALTLFDNNAIIVPTITIELNHKWYELYVVYPDKRIELLDFEDLNTSRTMSDNISAYVDHCPNPLAVERYADAKGYHVDELAMELMIGRWFLEVRCKDLAEL